MENVRNRRTANEGDCKEAKTLLENGEKVEIQKNSHISQKQGENTQNPSLPKTFRAIRFTVYIVHKALNVVYVPLFIYRFFEKTRKCTRVDDELLMIPANELTRKIRRKEISCEKVIRSYISRIKDVNPLLNAVIDERFADAIEDAKKVDQLVSSEDFDEESVAQQYPLLGIPVTVKGSIAVKGLKHTSGMITRKDLISENDAVAVGLARRAGAIPLLVSNVPELCMNWESTNKLTGQTRNPYDITRTCGGSSGGEATLISSGASLVGIGSDMAGSLRLPAHYCGIWAHKPSPGVVSYDGHYPSCSNHDQWEATFTMGPMARYAGDLRTLLSVLSNPDKKKILGLDEKVNIKNVKVYFTKMENYFWGTPIEPSALALQNVIDYFQSTCDTSPKKIDVHLFQYATDLATVSLMNVDDIDSIFGTHGNGVYSEFFRYITFRSKYSFSTIFYGLMKQVNSKIPEENKEIVRNSVAELRKEFENILGKDGVFILPSFPVEAIKHGDWLRFALGSGYMSIFNALGFPVTNCPIGMTQDGLPIGFQVVGLPYSDKLTLTVAEHIEEVFGGWRTPDPEA